MANSGSGRRSGGGRNRPAGSGNRAGGTGPRQAGAGSSRQAGGPRQGSTSPQAGSAAAGGSPGANSADRRQSADERARQRLTQQRAGTRRGSEGAVQRGRPAKGRPVRRPKQRSTTMTAGIFGSIFVVLAVVIIIVIATLGGSPKPPSGVKSLPTEPAPPSIVQAVANVPTSELNAAGTGGGQVIFAGTAAAGAPVRALKNPTTTTSGGKPLITYVGAEYCPFCAATRWPLAIALSKFGTLHGLKITGSSPVDFAADTHTLSFYGVTYTSKYLSFSGYEETTNVCTKIGANPNPPPKYECTGTYTPLQKLPTAVGSLVGKYDNTPYFSSSNAGGIPFIDIAGHWVQDGAPYPSTATQYPPISLQGLTWQQITNTFTVPTSGPGQAILGAANHYIAAFCQLTHNQPGNVCSMSGVKAVEAAGLK